MYNIRRLLMFTHFDDPDHTESVNTRELWQPRSILERAGIDLLGNPHRLRSPQMEKPHPTTAQIQIADSEVDASVIATKVINVSKKKGA